VDAAQALAELTELSSQVTQAVVLDAGGGVLAATPVGDSQALAAVALDAIAAAGDLHGAEAEVTRVEVELSEGALFVLRDAGRTIAATTPPSPTAGLVAYDLRTCLQSIDADKPKRRRAARKSEEAAG
jgi:hypothetical protein